MTTPFFPLITVGIPTYNGEKFLLQAINSVLNQTYQNLELLITDNCSTDNTESIIREAKKRDGRIKYIRHSSNIGFINNFNSIPPNATGDYVIYFADDDYYDKDFIKLLWEEFVKDPSITMAIGTVKLITTDEKEIMDINNFDKAKTESTSHLSLVDHIARVIRYGHNREWSWGINLALHKKEALLKHPYLNTLIDPGTLFYRSIIFEGKIGFNSKAIFYKRTGGLSNDKNYGRPKATIKTKYDDAKNEAMQLYYESKVILSSKLGRRDKLKLTGVFLRYRFPELIRRNMEYTFSFCVFIFIKNPYRILKSRLFKEHNKA